MTKAQKQALVAELVTQLDTTNAVVITEYRGTSVAQMEQLRRNLHGQGISFKVAKNSLLKRALSQVGVTIDDPAVLDQPIALAVGDKDEVMVAKAIVGLNKEMESVIPLGGIINGTFVQAETIKKLSSLPSREQLYGNMVGSLASLPIRMVRTISNPIQGLVTALNQLQTNLSASAATTKEA